MKLALTILIGLLSSMLYAQNPDRILFQYDTAGNQTQRTFCINCSNSRVTDETPKEITDIEDEDLIKFSPEDIISYYPNPVKEELYLKWELINENKVSKIDIFSQTGQLLNSYLNLEKEVTKNISFLEYPQGTYLVMLNYTNGETKSITILKQ
jgi:hypothetical protein